MIQELRVQGFRSLKDVTWRPGRLNVLIGPNGGGKSNLLQALDLLRVSATGGLRDTILGMGGMGALVWDGSATSIRFDLEVDRPKSKRGPAPDSFFYSLPLIRLGNSGAFEDKGQLVLNGKNLDRPEQRPWFRSTFEEWALYSDIRVDQTSELRRSAVTRVENRVARDGQNLVPVLHTLYTSHSEFKEEIDKCMSAAFPDDYLKLGFPPGEAGRVQLALWRKHRSQADHAPDLSDGTLRFLLLCTILATPDPPALIAIDEPELGLHPRMLPIIAGLAAAASDKTQVIFTTHSPELLDAFGDVVPTVTIASWNNGQTELKTLAGEELRKWVKDYSLGRFSFSGEAEAIA